MPKSTNPFKELGVTGSSQWGRLQFVETDPALVGTNAIRTYDEIRRGDPTGMAMYHVLSLPVRGVAWHVEPGGTTAADKAAADFVWSAFNDMGDYTFNEFIADICLMFAYGWSQFWMVLKRRTERTSKYPDGRVGFALMEMVNHRAFVEWDYDEPGHCRGPIILTNAGQQITVPLDGSVFFRTSPEGGAPEGISIYRPAVRPYTYKRRLEQVEGIGLYRRWAGFPDVELPPGATTRDDVAEGEISDEERAEALVQAIYEDRMMGAVRPNGWGLNFGGPQGNVDTTMGDTIMRKDLEMARAILAQFMLQGLRSVGTQSLAGTLFDAFILSIDAYLESIRDELNSNAVALLLRWNNFAGLTAPPRLEYTSPRPVDLGQVAQYLSALTGSQLLTPDVTLETFLRSLVPGMPTEVDEEAWEEAHTTHAPEASTTPVTQDTQGEAPAEGAAYRRFFRSGAGELAYGSRRYVNVAGSRYAVGAKPAPAARSAVYRALADSNAATQRRNLEDWTTGLGEAIGNLPENAAPGDVLAKLDDYILAALLMFRERSMLDIAAAFWLGFGAPSGPPEALQALQDEIALADSWIGYAQGGVLVRSNPIGKPSLFGDIAGQLEGQVVAILLLLKQGRRDEIGGVIADAVKAATRGYSRAEQYAGHVWRGIWVGAEAQRQAGGDDGPVRWVLDPIAHHCHECPIYGADPPGREYPSLAEMLRFTGGTLPGYGTECDGYCRCHLEDATGLWL